MKDPTQLRVFNRIPLIAQSNRGKGGRMCQLSIKVEICKSIGIHVDCGFMMCSDAPI